MLTRENVATSLGNEQQSNSGDKLHRRNPIAVRQEIPPFDDVVLETMTADVQLNELPGLQNTEEWKRIATRSFQEPPSPDSTIELKDEPTQQILELSHQTQDTENEDNKSTVRLSLWHTPHGRFLFIVSIIAIIIAIIVAVIVTVMLVRKPGQTTTDYYSGCIAVEARFDSQLLFLSSTLTINYQREFCSLVNRALVDAKTKYAVFYSTCYIHNFRNGSIIGDFTLGFTRYQNVTRLNSFLSRTIINRQLFGGTIKSIVFNSTIYAGTKTTDNNVTFDGTELVTVTESEQDTFTSSSHESSENVDDECTDEEELPIGDTATEKEDLISTSTLSNDEPPYDDKPGFPPPPPKGPHPWDSHDNYNEDEHGYPIDNEEPPYDDRGPPKPNKDFTPSFPRKTKHSSTIDNRFDVTPPPNRPKPPKKNEPDDMRIPRPRRIVSHLKSQFQASISYQQNIFHYEYKSQKKMSDENRDPSSSPLQSKIRPKPVDAKSAAASSLVSSLDSPKSATITNVSQRLPSTSVEVSVGDILSTDDKRASVSVRKQQTRYSSSSGSSSEFGDITQSTFTATNKMDLGEATRELTRLLHIGNDNTINEIHLNPDAPAFTPTDFSPTYRSELAPAHLRRRATQGDQYNYRQLRSRYYSESYPTIPTSNSPIRPLLSLVPQHFPYNRQSWNTTNSPSNSWWQQEYSNSSNSTSSYHSKPAYSPYSPLMPPLTDDSLYPNRHSSKRQRVHSNRAFVFPNQSTTNRKRSHSGPETPLQVPPTHLNGIHSLTKIMIDILRIIDPLPIMEEQKQKNESISPTSNISSKHQQKYRRSSNSHHQRRTQQQQQQNESIDTEDVFVNDEIPTITASINKISDTSDENKNSSKMLNDNGQKQILSIISTDTNVDDTANVTSKHPATDESFYEVVNNEESSTFISTPTIVSSTSTANTTN
ncbi:unnamed protein product [Rotaria sordida]|uniref:SEA domain-containing protein n=3 Tax=Rotaria sordida TaxID=392033 RepID=A0A815ETZ8_9BILA|nr:unnamed protein product [Rotaria sordida]